MILLASTSPRRRQLLDQIGVRYRAVFIEVDETRRPHETPEDYVMRIALAKAREGKLRARNDARPALGADTAVVLGEAILGKPASRKDGLEMLSQLSGKTHRVLSAVALVGDREAALLSVSTVRFRRLSKADRERYWSTGEGTDKAGAYAIQGRAAAFTEHLAGSYSGVMGLPLYETAQLLDAFGIDVLHT
jgi:septum formation protein